MEIIIGKLKTERYGDRILEEVKNYGSSEQARDDEMLREEEEKGNRPWKKVKTKKDVVLVESSDDEA